MQIQAGFHLKLKVIHSKFDILHSWN